jgi:hypothetical protein
MQLGDWVEFETIVVKQPTATGSSPTTTTLARKRRGMVIGERSVYDVTSGSPPGLSNRRKVLLVAVSLHRAYRVFPNEAHPTTPPQPRRRRAQPAQPATAQTTGFSANGAGTTNGTHGTGNGGSTMARTPIARSDLELLVADQINQQANTSSTFTAYEITQALRAANPGLEIVHDEVRRVVHAQMEALVATSIYARDDVTFGTDRATRYVPA